MNEKSINIVSKYHQKENLANTLYLKQDEFDLSNPFEVANCVINLGYRKINDNEIVLTKEQYKELTLAKQSIFKLLDEREDKTRKETAKEIFVKEKEFIYNKWKSYITMNDLTEIAKQFGVEIGEEK